MSHLSKHYLDAMLTHVGAPMEQRLAIMDVNRHMSVKQDYSFRDSPIDPMAQVTKAAVMVALSKNHADDAFVIGIHSSSVLDLQELSNEHGGQKEIAEIVEMIMNDHVDTNIITIKSYIDNKSAVDNDTSIDRKTYDVEQNNKNYFEERTKAWGPYLG